MIDWVDASEELPPFNKRVIAWLEGEQFHSGVNWDRSGYAFMVRHDSSEFTVDDGWASGFYDKALTDLSADSLRVTHWGLLVPPRIAELAKEKS